VKIKTISSPSESKFKEKGSLFIGKAFPISDKNESKKILSDIRKEYYDATHHCYAYIAGDNEKFSDDGEPSGTAGKRILNALNHCELKNVLVIVVRYFGGVKLGVGPLGKAYYNSALETLQNAETIEKTYFNKIKIEYEYPLTKTIHHFINKFGAIKIENDFESTPVMYCFISADSVDNFRSNLLSAVNNSVKINISDSKYLF